MNNKMTKLLGFLMIFTFLNISLAGCNTMEGLGKDIQKVGEEIEEKADK